MHGIAKVQSSIDFDILWLFFALDLPSNLARHSILYTVSQMDLANVING